MFEKTKNVTIVVLLFILITGSNVYASGDTQFWTTGGVSTNISKDWNLSVDEEIRFSEEGNIFYHHTNLDLTYSGIADWMDIGIYIDKHIQKVAVVENGAKNINHNSMSLLKESYLTVV